MVVEEILKCYVVIINDFNALYVLLEIIISINIDKCQ